MSGAGQGASENHRKAGACALHQDLAWLYDDGGVQCMNRLVVESSSDGCIFASMPDAWLTKGQLL